MTAYFVIDLNVPDPQKLAEYETAAGPLLKSLLHNRFRERRDDVFWCVLVLTALAKHDSIAALPRHGPSDGAPFS